MTQANITPHMNEFAGPLSKNGMYQLKLFTRGPLTAAELRNLIAVLELTASWLEEDAAQEMEARKAETSEAQAPSRSDESPVGNADAPNKSECERG